MATWLARLSAARRREDLVGVGYDPAYDIADPVGGSRDDYDVTADELDGLLGRLVALAWPAAVVQQGQERSA